MFHMEPFPSRKLAFRVMVALAVFWLLGLVAITAFAYPRQALQYRRALIGNAHQVWGLDAPIATFAGQIHQESAWKETAQSPYAKGLAQFTDSTAAWISKLYPNELGSNQPFSPSWALRALVRYDRLLWGNVKAATGCDRWAMTLSAYNGGSGWLRRDQRLAASDGKDPTRWWGHVELYSNRAGWAFDENRGYPRRILLKLQYLYGTWGPVTECEVGNG